MKATEHRASWDSVGLSDEIRLALPDAAAAILVGSAVTRSHSVNDLDVIAFSTTVPLGTDRALSLTHHSRPLHIVAYHPEYFSHLITDETLYLLFYRELRKLRDGHVLFDNDGSTKHLLKILATKSPPRKQITPLVSWLLANPEPTSRAEFLLAVERLAFTWLHVSPEYRYSKPKWLLEDSAG